VGRLLKAQNRHFRPAHLHVLIFKEGYKTLISQVHAPHDRTSTPTSSSVSPAR
jgi:catechol 1,2-dioxygenase